VWPMGVTAVPDDVWSCARRRSRLASMLCCLAARRGRREIRSCWGVSRLPFLPAGSTPCEWAELPRELSTVSHSGQADAQRGQGVLEDSRH
jgi:hypothetical protein